MINFSTFKFVIKKDLIYIKFFDINLNYTIWFYNIVQKLLSYFINGI